MSNQNFNDDTIRSLISLTASLEDDDILSYRLSDCTEEIYLGNNEWQLIDELHIHVDIKNGKTAHLVFRPHSITIRATQ